MFVLLGGLTAFAPLSLDTYLPALPAIGQDLHAGESEVQLTLTACLVGLGLGQAVAGPLSDTLGRRRPLLFGVAAYTAASVLCAVAPSATALVALRLVQGLAGSAGIVIARAIVRDMYSGVEVARYFSRLILIIGLAPIVAPVLGGQLLRFTSWRGTFVLLAGIGLVLLVSAAAWLPETVPVDRRRDGSLRQTILTYWELATDRAFITYAAASGLAFGGLFAYIAGSPFVLQGIYHVSPQVFSVVFGLNACGFVAASQVNARLVGRVPLLRLLAAGLIANVGASAALLAVALAAPSLGLPGLLVPLFFVVASVGFIVPNATALALADRPEVAGTGSALLGVLQFAIGAAAAPLVGVGGLNPLVALPLVIGVCGGAAFLAFLTRARFRSGFPSQTAC